MLNGYTTFVPEDEIDRHFSARFVQRFLFTDAAHHYVPFLAINFAVLF